MTVFFFYNLSKDWKHQNSVVDQIQTTDLSKISAQSHTSLVHISWTKETMAKTIDCLRTTALFYKNMGLFGNVSWICTATHESVDNL